MTILHDVYAKLCGAPERFELIQVCWSMESSATLQRELRGLRAAMAELGCPHGTIVSWQDESALVADEDIAVIPAWRFVLG